MPPTIIPSPAPLETDIERRIIEDWTEMSNDPDFWPLDFEEFRAGYIAYQGWHGGVTVFAVALAS
ncbi:MAG TPA: hypothetical protein VGJ82_12330 [Thermoanaerobaculia bacterium]|jgi:hypothetical protein